MATNMRVRKRVWVQDVAVAARALQTRLDIATARGLAPEQEAAAEGVRELLSTARNAAFRDDPIPGKWTNWWRGTLVDAAYKNLHAARTQILELYNEAELDAEIPSTVARARETASPDDPRYVSAGEFASLDVPHRRALLRRSVEDGYDSLDGQHRQLHSFRNIILTTAALVALLVVATVLAVTKWPEVMPLCFVPNAGQAAICPTGTGAASSGDILVVGLLGLLGGALAAAVSIRNLKGTSSAYDVPVALAALKVPLGAFTAILGLVAIRGEFIPGLSALDSQAQVLAYALVLGYGQQLLTRLLDRQAQDLLNALPEKSPAKAPGAATSTSTEATTITAITAARQQAAIPGANGGGNGGAAAGSASRAGEPELLPNPEGDEGDQVQDDDTAVLASPPAKERR